MVMCWPNHNTADITKRNLEFYLWDISNKRLYFHDKNGNPATDKSTVQQVIAQIHFESNMFLGTGTLYTWGM